MKEFHLPPATQTTGDTVTTTTLARSVDHHTSHQAAAGLSKRSTQCLMLLDVFCDAYPQPLIAAEATARAGLDGGGWKRVSDLKNAGYIGPVLDEHDTFLTQTGPNGRACMAWKATDKGLSVLAGKL